METHTFSNNTILTSSISKETNSITVVEETGASRIIVIIYITGLFDASMMISGAVVVLMCVYIGVLWSEGAVDERDEYIRSKVDRSLYILAIFLISANVLYYAFLHIDYKPQLVILCVLSASKLLLSKIIKEKN